MDDPKFPTEALTKIAGEIEAERPYSAGVIRTALSAHAATEKELEKAVRLLRLTCERLTGTPIAEQSRELADLSIAIDLACQRLRAAESSLASEREAYEETKRERDTLKTVALANQNASLDLAAKLTASESRASALAALIENWWQLRKEIRLHPRKVDEMLYQEAAALSRPASGATTEHDGEEGKRG